MLQMISRRAALLTGALGLGGLTTLGGASAAAAAASSTVTPADEANQKLVEDFFAAWNTPDFDLNRIFTQYLAPNAVVRWDSEQPAAHGLAAAIAAARPFLPPGATVFIKVEKMFVHGPLVASARVDTITKPGKSPEAFAAAGVHIVQGGKIIEYTDYIIR